MRNENKRNSKTKSRMTMKFCRHLEKHYIQGTMEADFKNVVVILNYGAKLPDWLTPGCHGNRMKNSDPQFPAYSHPSHTPQV